MKFLFDDESFSFETLRAAGFANDGGSDLGEVLATARNIGEGDEDAWLREWKNTAQRVHAIGSRALAAGHRVSAREALLRASNYYRTAEFYRRDDPANDPEVKLLSTLSRETFAQAAALMDTPVEAVRIPYQDTSLPGYLFLVDDSGTPAPPSSSPAASTPPWRRSTSSSPRPRCAAVTTCWPTTAPARARHCANRHSSSAPTGRPW